MGCNTSGSQKYSGLLDVPGDKVDPIDAPSPAPFATAPVPQLLSRTAPHPPIESFVYGAEDGKNCDVEKDEEAAAAAAVLWSVIIGCCETRWQKSPRVASDTDIRHDAPVER